MLNAELRKSVRKSFLWFTCYRLVFVLSSYFLPSFIFVHNVSAHWELVLLRARIRQRKLKACLSSSLSSFLWNVTPLQFSVFKRLSFATQGLRPVLKRLRVSAVLRPDLKASASIFWEANCTVTTSRPTRSACFSGATWPPLPPLTSRGLRKAALLLKFW